MINTLEDIPGAKGIDYRSFHAFKHRGEPLLFDRATGAVLEIGEGCFTFFSALERGATWDEAITSSQEVAPQFQLEDYQDLIRGLRQRGMFQFQRVDHQEQDAYLRRLWNHKPRRIQLLMAQGCNLGCRYCYAWRNGSNQKGTLMTFEVAKASVDFLVQRSGNRPNLMVTFFGGEPLLNYSMVQEVVSYCKSIEEATSKEFSFEIITNGTLLTREVTDYLAANKFLMMISIDGWEEMHNYNRPSLDRDTCYQSILENALYAKSVYEAQGLPNIKIRTNLTSKYHDAQSVFEYFDRLGFSKIGIAAIEPLPHGDKSPSAMTEDQMDESADKTSALILAALEKVREGVPLSGYEKRIIDGCFENPQTRAIKGVNCGIGRNTAIVDNQGNIFPCHRYEGMMNYVMGNVFEGMSYEKTMAYYRKVNRNATSRCHSCWIRDYCTGGCAWLLSSKDGTLVDPTERECNRRRAGFEVFLYSRKELRRLMPAAFAAAQNRDLAEFSNCGSGKEGDSCKCATSQCDHGSD